MASSADNFTYWHEGTGQHVFAWATTLTVLGSACSALYVWGARHEGMS